MNLPFRNYSTLNPQNYLRDSDTFCVFMQVIGCEGNAAFYEVGTIHTPLSGKYLKNFNEGYVSLMITISVPLKSVLQSWAGH